MPADRGCDEAGTPADRIQGAEVALIYGPNGQPIGGEEDPPPEKTPPSVRWAVALMNLQRPSSSKGAIVAAPTEAEAVRKVMARNPGWHPVGCKRVGGS